MNGCPDQPLGVALPGSEDELIAFAQSEGESNSCATCMIVQLRDGTGINRIAVNHIAAGAVAHGITDVAGRNGLDHKFKACAGNRVPRRR
jgi:hypothetical protein